MANPKKQQRRTRPATGSRRRKYCYFCKEGVDVVDYKDYTTLRRFMSERGKIRSRRTTGACRRHQRQVAVAIKRAREVALLPYSSR
ncbi:MAG: 30S ribosomal protein S18 [Thermoleophilia bacterium]|nr:30S ribosomal protein S18 [Thermoleophilia bacterium]